MIKLNKTILIGRLTADPELKFTPGTGTAVATFSIAIDRKFKKEGGEKETDFIPIVVWGKSAENCANFTAKGKLIGISGRIQTRSYDAKDGTKRYVTEVVAEEVQFLEWSRKAGQKQEQTENYVENLTPVDDGDIPF